MQRFGGPIELDGYDVESLLGSGGMGAVYRARSPVFGTVALKVLHERLADPATIERFRSEAALRISHPNVIRVIDAGTSRDGAPYYVMEHLEGETLAALIERAPVSIARASALLAQAAEGLAAVHAAGVIHRDVKPGNLFVCADGVVKVLDFGIARRLDRSTRMTHLGSVLGTPSYLSPEQARGEPDVDARADIWALGAVLHECLTQRAPFDRDTPLATMVAVIMDSPPPLPREAAFAASVVSRCLAKLRDERYASMLALRDALSTLTAPTLGTEPTRFSTAPGLGLPSEEQRLVVVLLAEGVHDTPLLRRAIESHGGLFSPVLGGGAIGVFGSSRWEGDEAVRAAHAALASRGGARAMALASGRATAAGRAYLSGRAMDDAERGLSIGSFGIAVADATVGLLRASFALRPAAAGFHEIVSERRQRSEPPGATSKRLTVARDSELGQLRLAIETVVGERRSVAVSITGPSGIGKTHLVREALDMVRRADAAGTILTGAGRSVARDVALSFWRGAIELHARRAHEYDDAPRIDASATPEERRQGVMHLVRAAGLAGSDPRELATFLGELLGIGMAETPTLRAARTDPELMHDRMRIAIADLLEGLASRPLAIFVDDAQWVDRESLDVLTVVLRRNPEVPLLVVASGRGDDWAAPLQQASTGFHLKLRPLTLAACATLARAVAEAEVPEPLLETILQRTDGNPFFVTQIVAELRDHRRLASATAPLPLPLTIEGAVQTRIDALEPAARDACKRLAACGASFSGEMPDVLGIPGAAGVVRELVRKELLVSVRVGQASLYQFKSSVIADVAYGMLTPALRVAVHERIASHLASTDADPEEIARHREQALDAAGAARAYATAALSACARGEFERVLRCAGRARELDSAPAGSFELDMACADASRFLRRRDDQDRFVAAAVASAPDDAARARALIERGVLLVRSGSLEAALAVLGAAATGAEAGGDREQYAIARGRTVAPLVHAGRIDEARGALQQAAAIARAHPSPRLRAFVAEWRGLLASGDGDLGERFVAYADALAAYREIGDLRRAAAAELNMADVHNRVGDFDGALVAVEGALATCRHVGNRLIEGYALLNLGFARVGRGETQLALGALDEAEQHASGDARLAFAIAIYRSRALLTSRVVEARALARHAVEHGRAQGMRDLLVSALVVTARAALALGKLEEALTVSAEALEIRDALGGVEEDEGEVFVVRREALLEAGRAGEAEDVRVRGESRIRFVARRIASPEWRQRYLQHPLHGTLLSPTA